MLRLINKNKKIKAIIVVSIIFALILSVICIKKYYNGSKKEIFTVDSRISKMVKEKEKDDREHYDTIGWLKVQGTNIDTPIIKYKYKNVDDDEIEEEQIDKENYLWNNVDEDRLLNKINILGHNILNLSSNPDVGLNHFSRFDDLMAFVYYDFVKDNKYIQYTWNGKDYIYQIYSVEFVKDRDLDLYVFDNYTKEEMKNFINKSIKNSLYKFDIKVDENDKIISLITCTRFFGDNNETDFVVNAKLVKDNEFRNYNVHKMKKYKKIEKILKSEVEDNGA